MIDAPLLPLSSETSVFEALLQEAAEQIRDRNYGVSSSKPLIRAAAVFSEAKRAFVGWADADAGKNRR